MKTKTVIIVGGGLAGSLTATSLQEQCKVTLFTKKIDRLQFDASTRGNCCCYVTR